MVLFNEPLRHLNVRHDRIGIGWTDDRIVFVNACGYNAVAIDEEQVTVVAGIASTQHAVFEIADAQVFANDILTLAAMISTTPT